MSLCAPLANRLGQTAANPLCGVLTAASMSSCPGSRERHEANSELLTRVCGEDGLFPVSAVDSPESDRLLI